MKVLQINAVSGMGSTGKIVEDVSNILSEQNIENIILYSYGTTKHKQSIKYMSDFQVKFNAGIAKILGNYGFNSFFATKKLIAEIKKFKPDVIHLHNLHGHNVHYKHLFEYLKKQDIKLFWTFHDCNAFTGYCMHFDYIKCEKWKEDCKNCPQARQYSKIIDKSSWIFNEKKKAFLGDLDLTIISPSNWLEKLVRQSFLQKYPILVINNGINLDIFKPTQSDFREKHNLLGKKVMLGSAMGMDERKGFQYFLELSNIIDDDCKIVLVGLNEAQISKLPKNILGISRTNNQKELAEIYTSADIFINPTLEDNFPTVNLEALACGTPIITFNTGGSVESVFDGIGAIVEQGDIKALYEKFLEICDFDDISDKCVEIARKKYNKNDRYSDYIKLYKGEKI